MTEDEWLGCADPKPMLDLVSGQAVERKLRLCCCACCRRVWHLLTREAVRAAVRTAEEYADGRADAEALRAGWSAVRKARASAPLRTKWEEALTAALHAATERVSAYDAQSAARAAARAVHDDPRQWDGAGWPEPEWKRGSPAERSAQSALLRCLFGNPFRPAPFDRAWLSPAVRGIAGAIYAEGNFADLPVLADALEDAGCANEVVLGHCRGGGPHARGCWVVDRILGKE